MPGARLGRGERVTLRTAEREDASFIQRGHANPEIRYSLGNLFHKNQNQIEQKFENSVEDDGDAHFLVCLDGGDSGPGEPNDGDVTPIGSISAKHVDWRRPDLACWLIPEVHGEGYGREAVSLVIDYVFRTFDAKAVGAAAYDHNEPSRALLESLGFTQEGRLRQYRFVDGEYRDRIDYGLLRREWRERDGT